jgi:hypothetical protein
VGDFVLNIIDEDKNYLINSMRNGEVVLILGAGASATSLNAQSKPVKQAGALATLIAERAGLPYNGEMIFPRKNGQG